MKKLLTLAVVLTATICMSANAFAVIGWAGNLWPADGANVTPAGDVATYCQVWKAGVTDAEDQGAGITADMFYYTDIDPTVMTVAAVYNVASTGGNDEYIANVPQAALIGATTVTVSFSFYDAEDASQYDVAAVTYNVIDVLPNAVDVTFQLCLSGAGTTGDVCVIGGPAEIGAWTTGVVMTQVDGDLYEITVTLAAGSSPSFDYKYQKDGCAAWHSDPNYTALLPTDGTTAVVLDVDSWNRMPIGCGLGNTLETDKEVCFQVCLDGIDNSGGVCVVGGPEPFLNWGGGTAAAFIGGGLYQACVVFPAGTAIPLNVEYKFKKDDCDSWESVDNRLIVIDNTLDAETTVTHNWDDNATGVCAPVPTQDESWGSLKQMYR